MREKLYEFLRFEKRKAALALLLPIVWGIIILFVQKLYLFLFPPPTEVATFQVTPLIRFELLPFLLFVFAYLFQCLLYYPFACSTVTLYDYYKKRELNLLRKNKTVIILIFSGFSIFNPIVLRILVFLPFILVSMIKPYEGVYVVEILQDSPAERFLGDILSEGRIIVELNDIKITNVDDALEVMNKTKPNDKLRIKTSGGSSGSVHLVLHLNINRGYLGIKVRDAQGNEAIL